MLAWVLESFVEIFRFPEMSAGRSPKTRLPIASPDDSWLAVGGAGADRLPLQIHYLQPSGLAALGSKEILAQIHYGDVASTVSVPSAHVPMSVPDQGAALEVWTSDLPVHYGHAGNIRFARNDAVLVGVARDAVAVSSERFEDSVYDIYTGIFRLIKEQGYANLLRLSNHFPDINGVTAELENYQRFCRGRARAFQACYGESVAHVPSASAVGTRTGELVVYFIASREPGKHRENPRQVSAYHYPPQYGPRSPSFARATLTRWNETEALLISGTASIVGYETAHPGDLPAQLEETLRNIEALIESTSRDENTCFTGVQDITHLKIYLRDAAYYPTVRARLEKWLSPGAQVLYLRGDICRRDLLLEIEALVRATRAPAR